jgi:hypothetical protein
MTHGGVTDLINAYLVKSIVDIPEELVSAAPLIKKVSGDSLAVIYYTHYIIKSVVFLRCNFVDLVNEEVVTCPAAESVR